MAHSAPNTKFIIPRMVVRNLRTCGVGLALAVLQFSVSLQASTLAPPVNLGELARHSKAVVFAEAKSVETLLVDGTPWTRTRFTLLRTLGTASPGTSFVVATPGGEASGVGLAVAGTPRFHAGRRYLLFLDRDAAGRWRPRTMAYGILEAFPGEYLAPLDQTKALQYVAQGAFEPPGVYRTEALLSHLSAVLRGASWDAQAAGRMASPRAPAPPNCVYMTDTGDGLPIRWFDFENGSTAAIGHTTPGQAGIADGGVAAVAEGVLAWDENTSAAVRLDYTGSAPRSVSCSGGSAIEFGDNDVIFNDPCGEVAELSGCSGTLAFGGSFYSIATFPDGGSQWHSASSPFVVVNNGTQCIGATSFKEMMTHELGHGLGFGHHTDSNATMAAFLNGDGRGASVTTTDRQCAMHSYSFFDVSYGHSFWPFIEAVKDAGVTSGCGNGNYCPDSAVTRGQMAVFLLKALEGDSYTPPPCTSPAFNDVPCNAPFAAWIEELAARNITVGCGGGNYCPDDAVTRAQMAVFLLRTLEGTPYNPPACVGVFNDVSCPSAFANWIEELAARGITAGCGGGNYCPASPNTRGQMAVFLTRTFGLVLP